MAGLLARERIVAKPGFNRWLVPPAALAIHLSIGQAYAFSVFKLPLTKVLGVSQPAPGDWKQSELAWIFTIAIVFLGLSAAVFGRWLEHAGPRKSGVVAALCWSLGFMISAVGVRTHQIWLLYLGYGVLGGCGLGLGYITPVSTLIKWFPDRRGMATGMAIMGFGGGAMIASPLSQILLDRYKSATSVGVAETFVTIGTLYLVAMLAGAFLFRVPPVGWKPAGWEPPAPDAQRLITQHHVHVDQAIRTTPFYFLWAVLFLNVTAGIGILEQASPMIQEMFKGAVKASAAAGFVGLLSLFNMGGRFGWSSLSDHIGRKATYAIFFTLGPLLYVTLPYAGRIGSVELFVACAAVILTMYGGGFATIPAYLSDIFGTQYVGAIHGRLLTAWSAAGVAGPVLVNYIREYRIGRGVPASEAYNFTMYLMAGLLVVGFFCNLAVRPVAARYYMTDEELARDRGLARGTA
ncbi:MAG TPA: OFA family MFS transporter [Gemmatimonadales bacterium]|jgi:MFS family permease|nr:OFA family MFS transporter [Gemmatimonadales bacterium]